VLKVIFAQTFVAARQFLVTLIARLREGLRVGPLLATWCLTLLDVVVGEGQAGRHLSS
jgi:hypothetical protein